MSEQSSRPPRDNLIRANSPSVEWRDESSGEANPLLYGHFSRFNEWTEIDSYFEGRFLERIGMGAYKKTFKERVDQLRVLFQHGKDPMIGEKPIAVPERLDEQEAGAYHESRLLDGVPELIVAGLRAKQYGQSFRMKVIQEDFNERPDKSDHNPLGLPERTINEIRLYEFGPVTFPAYANTTPGLRSLTDRFVCDWIERNPSRARDMSGAIDLTFREEPITALPAVEAAAGTSAPESRDQGRHSALVPSNGHRRSVLDV